MHLAGSCRLPQSYTHLFQSNYSFQLGVLLFIQEKVIKTGYTGECCMPRLRKCRDGQPNPKSIGKRLCIIVTELYTYRPD